MKKHQWIRPSFGHPYCSQCDQLELSATDECPGNLAEQLSTLRDENKKLRKALEAWDHWDYEVGSARANGESIYTASDFTEMRERARGLASALLSELKR